MHHANGIVSVNEAPIGPFSSSRRSPPSDRASRRLKASPRPTPGADCAASLADFENGRNSWRTAPPVQARSVVAKGQRNPLSGRCNVKMDAAVGRAPRVLDCIIHQVR